MRESLNEPVSVICSYNSTSQQFTIHSLSWSNDTYKLSKPDFYHKTKSGLVTIHHFSVSDVDGRMYFKLAFDSTSLHWVIEEYMLASEARVHYETFMGA